LTARAPDALAGAVEAELGENVGVPLADGQRDEGPDDGKEEHDPVVNSILREAAADVTDFAARWSQTSWLSRNTRSNDGIWVMRQ
jgi:hypothetical protein